MNESSILNFQSLAAVGMAIGLIYVLFKMVASGARDLKYLKGEPEKRELSQPINVQMASEFATVARVEKLDQHTQSRLNEITEDIRNMRSAMVEASKSDLHSLRIEVKGDIRGVHSRIDAVLAAVSDVSGQIKQMSKGNGK